MEVVGSEERICISGSTLLSIPAGGNQIYPQERSLDLENMASAYLYKSDSTIDKPGWTQHHVYTTRRCIL